jgi:hypothetical protein
LPEIEWKRKLMAANAELMETIVNQDSVLTQMRREHRFDLQQCLGTITASGKREAAVKGNIEAANKKTERAQKKVAVLTKQKETETEKRKLSEGEMGRLMRGKNMLTNKGRAIAKVVREGAEQDIKRVEQVASTKVCPVHAAPVHTSSHHPTTTTITTLPLRRQL